MLRPLLIWCALLTAALGFSQLPTKPSITNFSSKIYNGEAQVFDAVQDQRGVMYFANSAGVIEFDGKHWNIIPAGGSVLSLDIDKNGRIYYGGIGVVGYLAHNKKGRLKAVQLTEQIPEEHREFDKAWSTICKNGKVYFNVLTKLFVYDGEHIDVINPKEEFHLAFNVHKEVWVVEKSSGIYKVVGSSTSFIPNSDFFIGMSIFSILPYDGQRFLVATRANGIFIFDPNNANTLKPFNEKANEIFKEAWIYGGTRLSDGNFLYHTIQDGVHVLNPKGNPIKSFSRREGLNSSLVISAYQDKFGQVWCGLDNGIALVAYNSPYTFMKEGREYVGAINDLVRMDDRIYMATDQGLYYFKAGFADTVAAEGTVVPIPQVNSQSLDLALLDDKLFVATDGVYLVDGEEVTKISDIDCRNLCPVGNVTPPAILAGGNGGLAVLQRTNEGWKEVQRITQFTEEVDHIVHDIEFQSDSFNFWVGTITYKLERIAFDHEFQGYHRTPVVDSAGKPLSLVARRIGEQVVFNGSSLKGVGVMDYETKSLKEPVNKYLRKIHDLKTNIIKLDYKEDECWLWDNKKVYHFVKTIENEIEVDSISFIKSDIASIDAIYVEGEGVSWIGGTEGLVRYDRNAVKKEIGYYDCIIRGIVVGKDSVIYEGFYDRYVKKEVPEFSYEFNAIAIEYSAPFYEHLDEMRYSYMLEGYDKQFRIWASKNRAEYTNLPEGEYRFVVKAKNIYGQESELAQYEFIILPPWYRTWWAYLLYVIGLVSLVYSAIRLNAARLKREKAQLEKLVELRTSELADRNSALRSSNLELAEQKEIVEQKNKDITDSIVYAEKIQRALLSSMTEWNATFSDCFVLYKPKSILSGDFYWCHEDKETGKKVFACVDCTGHGVPGALMSMIGHSFLNKIIVENRVLDPGTALDQLRNHIIGALETDSEEPTRDGMDMSLCVFDPSTMKAEYAGANNPLWIISEREGIESGDSALSADISDGSTSLFEIKGDKQPVGAYVGEEKSFTTRTMVLEKGDYVYASTDGYPDQFGGRDGKKMKYKRLRQLLLDNASLSMPDQMKALDTHFEEWMGEMEQIDDVCVIGIRV